MTITQEQIAAMVKRLRGAGKHPMMDGNCKVDVYVVHEVADMLEQLAAERNPEGPVTVSSTEQDLDALVEYFKAKAENAYADGVRDAVKICDEERFNTAMLTSNPPQSAAAVAARNRIRALLTEKPHD